MHVDDALARFLVQLQADGRSPHTVGQYRRHLCAFASWLATRGHGGDVAAIDHEDLALFLASPEALTRPDGRPRRAGTMNSLRTSLRGFFEYLESAGTIEQSPARVLRMARTGVTPPKALRQDDAQTLLAALAADESKAGRRDHAMFAFLLWTGARLGSALALEVGDVDLAAGHTHLREVKGGGVQTVFLRPELVALLEAQVGDRRTGPLFEARDGGTLSHRHVQRRFSTWLQRAGVRGAYSPHSLRHTFATRLYERTGDVLLVKQALGHRAISSTMIYARSDERRVRAAVVGIRRGSVAEPLA